MIKANSIGGMIVIGPANFVGVLFNGSLLYTPCWELMFADYRFNNQIKTKPAPGMSFATSTRLTYNKISNLWSAMQFYVTVVITYDYYYEQHFLL